MLLSVAVGAAGMLSFPEGRPQVPVPRGEGRGEMLLDGRWAKGLAVLLVGMMLVFGLACGGGGGDGDSGDETTPAPEAAPEADPAPESSPDPDPDPAPESSPDPDPVADPDPDANGEVEAPSITGTWVRDQAYEGDSVWLFLKADGTFELRFGGSKDGEGVYEVTDDSQLRFRDLAGIKGCLMLPEGFYAFSLTENDLIMGASEDFCAMRAGVLSASWSRLVLVLFPII